MAHPLIQRLNERKAGMKVERSSFEPHWREIAEFLSTRTSRFLRTERNRGEKINQKIINETATEALRTLESGMMAGMSSPARPWFVLGPPDPEMKKIASVAQWLDTVTKIMLESFARSNLYSILPKQYSGIGAFGTAAFGFLDDDQDVFRAYQFPLGSYYMDCNARLVVDCFHREFSMTVRQMVEKWGKKNQSGSYDWSNFSTTVVNAWDKGDYGTYIPVNHAIQPNVDRDKQSLHSKDKAYASVYYEDDSSASKPLSEMGYDEFPVITSRWHVNGEDVYGTRSPGMDALGSIKALQLEERRKYQVIDKIWNPPMNADATLKNLGADLLPGGLNFVPGMSISGNPGIRPVQEIRPQAVEVLRVDIQDIQARIRRTFFADLMLMMATSENSNMTAREVEERHSEKLLVLGPMLEQQNDDTFDPLIDRAFNMLYRAGKFPPPPPELQNQPLRVEYISTMASAQKLIGVSALERFVGFVGNLSAVNPEAMDSMNVDEVIIDHGTMTGVNTRVMRSADEIAAIREGRAKQVQAEQMAERLPALAQSAQQMSQASMEGDTALTRMLQQAQGGAL